MLTQTYKAFDNDEYTITLEFSGTCIFVHCDVHKFSKSVVYKIILATELIKRWFLICGVDELFMYTKNSKFANLVIGDTQLIDIIYYEGEEYEVLLWELM